jgi:hypothetical protein
VRQRFCGSFDGEAVLLFSGEKAENTPENQVLVTEISFELETRQIRGYLGILLDLGASDRLIGYVDRYIDAMGMSR